MTENVACRTCDAVILATLAARTQGLCVACKTGYTGTLEPHDPARPAAEVRDPYHELYLDLLDRVFWSNAGFDGLSEAEKMYYAVGTFRTLVLKHGLEHYFAQSTGEDYHYAELGLTALEASHALGLLMRANVIFFPDSLFDPDFAAKRKSLHAEEDRTPLTPQLREKLMDLDKQFRHDQDGMTQRLKTFVHQHKLLP